MKVDDNRFPSDQNMVDVKLLKGKTKVLTSTKAKETETVDPKMQISTDEYREIKRRRDQQKSQYEQGETSRNRAIRPHVTSQILLNKMATTTGKGLSALVRRERIPALIGEREV